MFTAEKRRSRVLLDEPHAPLERAAQQRVKCEVAHVGLLELRVAQAKRGHARLAVWPQVRGRVRGVGARAARKSDWLTRLEPEQAHGGTIRLGDAPKGHVALDPLEHPARPSESEFQLVLGTRVVATLLLHKPAVPCWGVGKQSLDPPTAGALRRFRTPGNLILVGPMRPASLNWMTVHG